MTPYGPESGVVDAPEYPEFDGEFAIPALTDEYLTSGTKPLGMVNPQTGFISWDDLQADYGLTKEDFNQDEETMSKAADE
jgi:hypothetical protein